MRAYFVVYQARNEGGDFVRLHLIEEAAENQLGHDDFIAGGDLARQLALPLHDVVFVDEALCPGNNIYIYWW